jgi:phosphoesterase RecJ-like protein
VSDRNGREADGRGRRGPADGAGSARDAVLRALRDGDRFVLVTHENPDGDALGSLVAMHGVLEALGKDVVMFVAPDEFPLPYEYAWLPLGHLMGEVPGDLAERTVVFLDCGNIDRNPVEVLRAGAVQLLNIDHHHDNTRFGTIDYVVPEASCTAEIVWDLMRALGVAPTITIAEALYVGLVTDTGRFMYENTGVRAHVMAGELIDAGVDVHEVYRRLYEGVPEPKLALLARALGQVTRYDGGRLTFSRLSRADFDATGAEDSYTEGIIDHLRAVRGTKVAALVRELGDGRAGPPRVKVSLRAADEDVDVSAVARAAGGGGHRQAAGFTTTLGADELVAFLRAELAAQLVPVA